MQKMTFQQNIVLECLYIRNYLISNHSIKSYGYLFMPISERLVLVLKLIIVELPHLLS